MYHIDFINIKNNHYCRNKTTEICRVSTTATAIYVYTFRTQLAAQLGARAYGSRVPTGAPMENSSFIITFGEGQCGASLSKKKKSVHLFMARTEKKSGNAAVLYTLQHFTRFNVNTLQHSLATHT